MAKTIQKLLNKSTKSDFCSFSEHFWSIFVCQILGTNPTSQRCKILFEFNDKKSLFASVLFLGLSLKYFGNILHKMIIGKQWVEM